MGFPILVRRHLYIESGPRALSYYSDMTLSQEFQPMAAQLSMKAALPLAKILATASDRCSKTGPCCSSPPETHISTASPELESSALVSCDICWCIGVSLYHADHPVSWMQQSSKLSTTRRNIRGGPLLTHQQISDGAIVVGSSIAPVHHHAWVLMMMRRS